MGSPTPSTGSIDRTHSLGSLIDQNEYHSLSSAHSPLTASPTSLSSGGSNNSTANLEGLSVIGSTLLMNGHSHHHLNNNSLGGSGNNSSSSSCGGGSSGGSSHSSAANNLSSSQCGLCHGTFVNPKVLPCFHTFCEACLERNQEHPGKITCSRCQQECILTSRGVNGLLPDFTIKDAITSPTTNSCSPANSEDLMASSHCTSCKNLSVSAIVHCIDCNLYLCQDCMMAHQMVNFDGHRIYNIPSSTSSPTDVLDLKDGTDKSSGGVLISGEKLVPCPRHKTEYLKYFCLTCNVPLCKECSVLEHPSGLHDFETLHDAGYQQLEMINQAIGDSKAKANDIRSIIKNLDHAANKLQVQFHKAQNEVNDTFLFYRSMLEERKQEILKELESVFSAKQLSITVVSQKAQETVDKIYQTCDFVDRLMKQASLTECLLFKKLLDSKLQGLMSYTPEINLQNASDLEFVSNYQAIQVGVRNTFGYVRSSGEVNVGPAKQPPIARPVNSSSSSSSSASSSGSISSAFMMSSNGSVMNGFATNGVGAGVSNGLSAHTTSPLNGNSSSIFNGSSLNVLLENRPYSNGLDSSNTLQSNYETSMLKRFGNSSSSSSSGLGPFSSSISDIGLSGGHMNGLPTIGTYEKWSNGGGDIFQNGNDFASLSIGNGVGGAGGDMLDLTSKLLSNSPFPPKSQIKRQKMIYHCKFGEFGALEAQFTEPSGVAVNAQNDIIVADTNNHRIQIFDKEGRFRFQFGECGKRDGQLLYPNRVAVVKHSGDIIVTERSPTHQIQIYNQYGQFLRKFGATILQHPRGITVDNKGRIVVVECKVMRVIIFDQMGSVLQKFGCSKHLEFPNGVVVNDHQEIFISDNRAHCVKVFNYDGAFLRQIGSEGITNYPIGVGINAAGEILIADNHNNFNLTIFTQDGQLVSALESKVKHAQCFDVALMDDGSVVLASKDYRLYIYRYVQIPPIGL